MLYGYTGLLFLALIVIFSSLKVVKEYERGVKFTLGKSPYSAPMYSRVLASIWIIFSPKPINHSNKWNLAIFASMF